MGKIKYFPTDKENFLAYHKILWQAIIDRLRCGDFDIKYDVAIDIKEKCFNSLFAFSRSIANDCFGCQYAAGDALCKLFDTSDKCSESCLDSMWEEFESAIDNNRFNHAIKYARKIKNFPVRK